MSEDASPIPLFVEAVSGALTSRITQHYDFDGGRRRCWVLESPTFQVSLVLARSAGVGRRTGCDVVWKRLPIRTPLLDIWLEGISRIETQHGDIPAVRFVKEAGGCRSVLVVSPSGSVSVVVTTPSAEVGG
jgi:hypothetical protein